VTASQPPAKPAKEAVAALGRLQPAGDIRVLAAPIAGVGGSPRLTRLLVNEGDRVERDQLLALFDTGPSLAAEQQLIQTRLNNLARRLRVEQRELNRYRQLTSAGALSADELDRREQQYLQLLGEWQVARADLERVRADLNNTFLRAPITGTVLRIIARSGERPTDKGILELGANERMEALLEVYESDIDRVRLGQSVRLTSENGGFDGTLRGTVFRVSPQVRQREVLSTDPSGDVDARIVEVRVALTPEDAQRVRRLTGLKVVGRLEP
jgi:HlyD family secretion protein